MRQEINLSKRTAIRKFIFLIAIFITTVLSNTKCYSQEYEMPESAINIFLQGDCSSEISIEKFVRDNGGKSIVMENKKWCPSHDYYIEWRYLQLRYWFIVNDPKRFDEYMGQFESMIAKSNCDEFRKYGYVKTATRKDDFPTGCIDEAELMSSHFVQAKVDIDANALNIFRNDLQSAFSKWQSKQRVGEDYNPDDDLKNDFGLSMKDIGNFQKEMQTRLQGRAIGEKINKLKNKYYGQAGIDINGENKVNGEIPNNGKQDLNVNPSDVLKQYGVNPPNTSNGKDASQGGSTDGKDNKGGDGNNKKSWLPIKVSFSDWFGQLLEIVTEYLGIDNITKQMLSVAYFIAPELFDEVGSFFAKLQHSLTPKSLDDFLNSVSDIVDELHKFYRCAMAIKNMFADPEFQALFKGDLKNLPVDKIIQGIEKGSTITNKLGLISKNDLDKITKFTSYGKLLTEGDIKNNIKNFAIKRAKDFLLKTKIGDKIPFAEMEKCYDIKTKEECLKILTHGAVMNLPPQFNKYGSAIDNLVIKGNFKSAAKEVAMQEVNRIPKEYRDDVLKIIKGETNFSRDDLLRISKNVMKSTGNKELAALIEAGRGINYISENAESLKKEVANVLSRMNLSEESLAEFLNSETPELLQTMAKGFGFSDTEAQNLFVAGDINGAIKKQIEKGVPVRNWAYYQNFGQEIRNKTLSRIGIYQLMLEAMRQGYMPYNFTKLIQYTK